MGFSLKRLGNKLTSAVKKAAPIAATAAAAYYGGPVGFQVASSYFAGDAPAPAPGPLPPPQPAAPPVQQAYVPRGLVAGAAGAAPVSCGAASAVPMSMMEWGLMTGAIALTVYAGLKLFDWYTYKRKQKWDSLAV